VTSDHHDHGHEHHDHGHHGHGHHHHHGGPPAPRFRWRVLAAGALVTIALLAATLARIPAGTALVITRFGDPVRVMVEPGLAWKAPPPIDRGESVDLRLRTTSSGLHSVLTQDGLSVLVQAYAAWRVPAEGEAVLRYVRSTRNQPDEAAGQLRTFLGSALETVTSRFPMDGLLNTEPARVRLGDFRAAIRERLAAQLREVYGIELVDVGIERLQLPETTVAATINRMAAERDTIAEEKKAYGRKVAGGIRAVADRDARITRATAEEEASRIEAQARSDAAAIYGAAHGQDPQLYRFLRSLDTLDRIITPSTRLVLRTDAAPFDALMAPPSAAPSALATPAAPVAPAAEPAR
jgi:membrane protease subunit HflC